MRLVRQSIYDVVRRDSGGGGVVGLRVPLPDDDCVGLRRRTILRAKMPSRPPFGLRMTYHQLLASSLDGPFIS